ncbi:MAG: DUF4838 domain-containing protein [Phycisphaeraceae bacterium]
MFVVDQKRAAMIVAQRKDVLPIARELRRCLLAALNPPNLRAGTSPCPDCLEITVGAEEAAGTAPRIVLTVRPELSRRSSRSKEAIAWRCDGKARLEISGSNLHSLWLAMYAFLREHVGCRWFFPGKLGEDIPSLKHLRMGKLEVVHVPSFATRDWRNWPRAFQRQMLGSEHDLGIAHAYYTIVPAEVAKAHPEYTSMLNGRRRAQLPYQLCVSQKGVEDLAVQYCLDWFKEHPDAANVSLCPNDTNMFCDCPQCVATNLGPKAGKTRHPKPPHWVSRSIYEFSNRVAQRVCKVHPDKLLIVNGYGRTEAPPRDLKVHDNVVCWYATWALQAIAPAFREKMEAEVADWCTVARNVAIYEYIVNGSWPGLPRPIPAQIARCLKFWHRRGVRHYYSQHSSDYGMNLPNYHVAAALCWDVKQDPQAILEDLYARCFRKAGRAIGEYYAVLEKAITSEARRGVGPGALGVTGHERTHEQIPLIYTPRVLAEAQAAIDQATKAAVGDVVTARRVKIVADALKLLKAAVVVCRRTYAFENRFHVPTLSVRAWHIGNYDYAAAVEKLQLYGESCVAQLRALIAEWRDYDHLRRRLARTPAVNEFWSRGASFNPLGRLENIRKLFDGEVDCIAPQVVIETRVV